MLDLSFTLCTYAMMCVAAIEGFSLYQTDENAINFLICCGISLGLNLIGPWRGQIVICCCFLPEGNGRICFLFLLAVLLLEVRIFLYFQPVLKALAQLLINYFLQPSLVETQQPDEEEAGVEVTGGAFWTCRSVRSGIRKLFDIFYILSCWTAPLVVCGLYEKIKFYILAVCVDKIILFFLFKIYL